MGTDTARPDLLDMARELGTPDSRATATFSAASATFDGLAVAVDAGPGASFEAIEAEVRAQLARGDAAGRALALMVDALGNDDAPGDPDAIAAWATMKINGMQDSAAAKTDRMAANENEMARIRQMHGVVMGSMVDAWTEADAALTGTSRTPEVADIAARLEASPRLLATTVRQLAQVRTAEVPIVEAWGRLDRGTQDLDLFTGAEDGGSPAVLVEQVLAALRRANDDDTEAAAVAAADRAAARVLGEVAELVGLAVDAVPAAVLLSVQQRVRALVDIARLIDDSVTGVADIPDSMTVAMAVGQHLRRGAGARAVLVGLTQAAGFAAPDEREPVNDGRYLTDLLIALQDQMLGARPAGNADPTPARGISVRTVADIDREALDEIALAVMGPNPDAAGVPPERLVSPYAHEVVTAVRALVADRESWRQVARKVVDALNEHPDKRAGQPERLMWPAIELGTGPSLFDEVAEVVEEVTRWRGAARHMLSRTVMNLDGQFVEPASVLSSNLTPAETGSRIVALLEEWFTHGTAMLRASAAPSSDTSGMWGRRPPMVAERVVSTLAAFRADLTRVEGERDVARAELEATAAKLAAVPIERGPRFAGVLALLAAAAELDPTKGGTRNRVIPAHDPNHLGPLWDERVRLTGWLIERAEHAAQNAGEQP